MKGAMKKSIKFNLKPDIEDVEKLEKKISNFLIFNGFSDNTVREQSMILRELIKNGIKYGKFTPSKKEIFLHIHIAENTITVEVKNPLGETCYDQLKEFDKTIQFIRGYQDPFEAYMVKQKEARKQSSVCEANGLGLARVAYEGNAIFDFFISEGNILNQSAVRSFA
jgi:hypothetical protein